MRYGMASLRTQPCREQPRTARQVQLKRHSRDSRHIWRHCGPLVVSPHTAPATHSAVDPTAMHGSPSAAGPPGSSPQAAAQSNRSAIIRLRPVMGRF
jgi:hypothetical protein